MLDSDEHARRLKRLLRISRVNGWTVVVIAGLFGLLSLLTLDVAGFLVGAGVTGAGAMEIVGHRRLENGQSGARGFMVGSQGWLIFCVLIYCTWRLFIFDVDDPLAILGDSELLRSVATSGGLPMSVLEGMVTLVYQLMYRLVAALTLIFQGGLGLYYWLRVGALVEETATAPAP